MFVEKEGGSSIYPPDARVNSPISPDVACIVPVISASVNFTLPSCLMIAFAVPAIPSA